MENKAGQNNLVRLGSVHAARTANIIMKRLYKIKADDVIIYHRTYYVEAENVSEAKRKLGDDDYKKVEDRAGASFEGARILRIEKVKETSGQ